MPSLRPLYNIHHLSIGTVLAPLQLQTQMPISVTAPGIPDIGINWRELISDYTPQVAVSVVHNRLMSFNEPFRAGNPRQLNPTSSPGSLICQIRSRYPVLAVLAETTRISPLRHRNMHIHSRYRLTHRNQLRNHSVYLKESQDRNMTSWQADINSSM